MKKDITNGENEANHDPVISQNLFLCTDIFVFFCSLLKKDIKMTNIEELQIQSETYYREVLLTDN